MDSIYAYDDSNYEVIDNNTIKATKTGLSTIDVTFYDDKDKISYQTGMFILYAYDVRDMTPINTVEDLDKIREAKAGSYYLNANLDLSGIENFEPINIPYNKESHIINESYNMFLVNPYHYIIKGLTISSSAEIQVGTNSGKKAGLFGYVYESFIEGLILTDVNIDVSDFDGKGEVAAAAGGIAGLISSSYIKNCNVSGTIKGNYEVGGLVGPQIIHQLKTVILLEM